MSAGLRLMWKEYRVLRGFWLALAIFGLVCDGLIFLFDGNPQDRLPGLFALAGVLPACFALGAGATLFALEREESTRDLLRYLPLTSLRVFASKIWVALGGTLLLTLVLLSVGLAGVWLAFGESTYAQLDKEGALSGFMQHTGIYAVVVLQGMGWSIFFSLRSGRPLLAALLGAIGALVCVNVVHLAANPSGWFNPQPSFVVPFSHAAATTALWLVDAWLGSTWLHGRRVAVIPQPNEVTRPMPLGRLLWQEWRGSRRILAVLAVLGLILPLIQWKDPYSGSVGVIPAVGLVFALLGSCAFLGDQERSQFRFFAEHGVSGRSVWFSRVLFWVGASSILGMVLLAVHLLGLPLRDIAVNSASRTYTEFVLSWFGIDISTGTQADRWTIHWLTGMSGYVLWLSLAFGAGQLCSMFSRSGLLAAVFGVMLAGVLLAWGALMHVLSIGWWWSVAPLAVALFAATWLRANGWMVERRRFSAWLPSLLVLVVPAVAVLAAVPTYRVLEVPKIDLDEFRPGTQPSASGEARDAARRLLKMCELLPRLTSMDLQSLSTSTDIPPEDERWLRQNQVALDALVDALLRLPADATSEGITWDVARVENQTVATLIRYGQMAECAGDLDHAWTRYRALLNFARFARRLSPVLGEVGADSVELAAAPQLIRWGAKEGQTVERLSAAADVLQQLDRHDGSVADVVWRQYEQDLARIEAIELEVQLGEDNGFYGFFAKWAPWEFARARRLVRYVTFLDLQEARTADTSFAGGIPYAFSAARSDRAKANLLSQTTLLQDDIPIDGLIEARRSALCFRRAAQLALAVERWRLEHGELPEKLDELKEDFGSLRNSPYTNQPFLWFPWGLRRAVRSNIINLPDVPAHTPLLYAPTQQPSPPELQRLYGLRRPSAHDQWKEPVRPQSGTAMPAAPPGGSAPMGPPAGMGAPGMPPEAAPTHPWVVVDSEATRLDGLAFPIPDESEGSEDL